jgi:hypothetical protein
MTEISAYGIASQFGAVERRVQEKTANDGDQTAVVDVSELIVGVASELGVGKTAIALCRVIHALFGWLVDLFRKLFGSAGETLPESYKDFVKDVKGIVERDSGPRNREKHALHGQLRKLCNGWKSGTRAVWLIMRAIRRLPKDRPVSVVGSTFQEWTESLNDVLGLELRPAKNSPDQPVPPEARAALAAALQRHCKGAAGAS